MSLSISIPESVTGIGWEAFSGCKSLTSISIPAGVTEIGDAAFAYCSGLTLITVADGNSVYHSSGNCLIETATKTLIAGCKTSVIPADGSVTKIGRDAFYGCTGLTSVTIPESVTEIYLRAFDNCTSLTDVFYLGSEEQWEEVNCHDNPFPHTVKIHFGPLVTATDDDTGISATFAGDAFEGEVTLKAEKLENETPSLPGSSEAVLVYDISFMKDGAEMQPGSPVTVRIPLPEGSEEKELKLYHIKDDGTAEEVAFTVEAGFIVFTAAAFSKYVIAEVKTPAGITGDVDGSGEITPADARLALRIALGLMKDGDVDMTEEMQARADVDGKDGVQPADARLILRKSLGLVDPEWVG